MTKKSEKPVAATQTITKHWARQFLLKEAEMAQQPTRLWNVFHRLRTATKRRIFIMYGIFNFKNIEFEFFTF
jgi:hypothetical protein